MRCPAHHHVLTAATSGHATVRKATTRSWRPNRAAPTPSPSEATAMTIRPAAGRATRFASAHGPPGRAANQGQTASRANDAVATTVWPAEDPVREGRGSAATARVATPPAASRARPARRAGTSAHAVTRWARPVSTSPVVMIQRCGVPDAASALIDSAPESKPPGCAAAAHVHPPTRASTASVALSTAVRGRPVGSLLGSLVGSGMRTTLGRVRGPPDPIVAGEPGGSTSRTRCSGPSSTRSPWSPRELSARGRMP